MATPKNITPEEYKKYKDKVSYYEKLYGKDSKEYRGVQEEFKIAVANYVEQQQNKERENLNSLKKKYEKEENYAELNKLQDKITEFEDNTIDFSKTKKVYKSKSNITIDKEGKRHGYGSKVYAENVKDIPDDVFNIYENKYSKPTNDNSEWRVTDSKGVGEDKPTTATTTTTKTTSSDGGGVNQGKRDLSHRDMEKDPYTGEVYAKTPKAPQETKNTELLAPTEYDKTLPSDSQKNDIGGYLGDAARFVMGVGGALKKVPQYQESPEMRTMIDETMDRRNMGLSPSEIALEKTLGERAYGYDVQSIKGLSGGSAGTALANLGAAGGRLQDAYAQTAVRDEMTRRENRGLAMNFAAPQAEAINQQKFGLEYEQTMMSKQAGAALAQDAMKNIKDRIQFQDTYGKGSQYSQYMDELTLGMRQDRAAKEDSQKNMANMYSEPGSGLKDAPPPIIQEEQIVQDENVVDQSIIQEQDVAPEIDPLANEADNYKSTETSKVDEATVTDNEVANYEPVLKVGKSEFNFDEENQRYTKDGVIYDIEKDKDGNEFVNLDGNITYLKKKESKVVNDNGTSKATHTGTSVSPSSKDFNKLVDKVMMAESGGNENAVSPKGAKGLMQLMPNTSKDPGYGIKPAKDDSPEENMRVGKEYLSAMIKKFGNETHALMAYNWGPGNVDKWLKGEIKAVPKETKDYVKKILNKDI